MLKITAKTPYRNRLVVLALTMGLAVSSLHTWAQPDVQRQGRQEQGRYQSQGRHHKQGRPAKQYQEKRQTISQSRAAALAKQRFGGKVLRVQRQQSGKRVIYKVKLLQKSGHVKQVLVNAETGAILGR